MPSDNKSVTQVFGHIEPASRRARIRQSSAETTSAESLSGLGLRWGSFQARDPPGRGELEGITNRDQAHILLGED